MSNDDPDVAVRNKNRFEEHLQKYLDKLFALVLKLTQDRERSREIAQQTISKYFSKMEETNWQEEIKNEEAYLAQMARNLVNDGWRAGGKADLSLDELDERSTVPAGLQCTFDMEKSIYLEELLKIIPFKIILGDLSGYELWLLWRRDVDGAKFEEIAQEVNEKTPVVRYDHQKIMAKIRARVKTIFGKKTFFKSDS